MKRFVVVALASLTLSASAGSLRAGSGTEALAAYLGSRITKENKIQGENGLLPGHSLTACLLALGEGPSGELRVSMRGLGNPVNARIEAGTLAVEQATKDRIGNDVRQITFSAGPNQDLILQLNAQDNLKAVALVSYDVSVKNNDIVRGAMISSESVVCSEFWSSK